MSQTHSQMLDRHGRSSIQSRSVSHYISVSASDVDDLPDNDLVKYVNQLKIQTEILRLENEILELVILRLDPNLMHGVQQAYDYAAKIRSNSSLHVGSSFTRSNPSRFFLEASMNASKIFASQSRLSARRVDSSARLGTVNTVIFGTGPKINLHERSELVSTQMEILVKKLEKFRAQARGEQALLKAKIEEVSVRVQSVEKANESFNQQVIKEGWDKIAQRIPAEVWIRYLTEWVKLCDKHIGKLRLRTSTLSTQYIKLKGQIKVKAELSESLRPVDFDKLKIENKEALELIDKKITQLVELKKMTGDANLNLAIHKKLMMEQNDYLTKLKSDIMNKNRAKKYITNETHKITDEVNDLAEKLEDVKKVRLRFEVPDIMDYVQIKSDMADLRHTIKMLENKFHVQQIALKSLNRKLHSMFFE